MELRRELVWSLFAIAILAWNVYDKAWGWAAFMLLLILVNIAIMAWWGRERDQSST